MNEMYILIFLTGLTGGFGHCIGMCGPVVVAYSVSIKSRTFLPHILYNAGRISTYTILGGLMGLTGTFIIITGPFQQLQKGVMIAAGLLIIIMGVGLAGWLPFMKRFERILTTLPFIRKIMGYFSGEMSIGTFYPMGIVLGFIPCGLVYTALLSSARAGMETDDPLMGLLRGAVLMLLFGVGTAPSLLLFGKIVNVLGVKLRERLYKTSAIIMIIMGVLFVVRAAGS